MGGFLGKTRRVILLGLIGACSFWLPDVALHAIARSDFSGLAAILATILCPLASLVVYLLVRRSPLRAGTRWPALPMLIAIWVTGGFFITVSSSFAGGGFAAWNSTTIPLLLASIIPFVTFMMATYDGTLFALIGVTAGALVVLIVDGAHRRRPPA